MSIQKSSEMQTQEATENKTANGIEEAADSKEESKQTDNSIQEKEKKEDGSNYSWRLAILGGAVGAGIGWFANRDISKKAFKNLSESEFVKIAGHEFKKTALEILAGQAQSSVKQLASGYLNKIEKGLHSPKISGSENSAVQKQPYEEVKEENKNINERLKKLEDMLTNFVESK